MPINEANRKVRRERWPLEFDIEGVPRDTATRKQLLEQKQQVQQSQNLDLLSEEPMSAQTVRNSFAVDKPAVEITDINNPPRRPYNPQDPKNEFPKMLYHHESGRVLAVQNEKEQKAAHKRGFELKPSPDHDYSKITRAGVAAVADHAPKREEEMSAEELAAMDEEEES
jgi:hypothetical protein